MAENVAWLPQSLAATGVDVADLSYLLVEEIVRAEAHLQRWAWPTADRDGRLSWVRLQPLAQVAVPVDVLRWQLYQPQTGGLRRRSRAIQTRWSAADRPMERLRPPST